MQILKTKITKSDLGQCQNVFDGPMVKGAVDINRKLLAVDAPMHADLEQLLLNNGSSQDDLWGINLYFEDEDSDFVEFDSMINIRPRQGNCSRSVENPETRAKIIEVVNEWMAG